MLALCVLCLAHVAAAHPFGLSSVNRYLGIECTAGGGLRIAWVLDFAELPAAREIARLDRDGDGAVTPAERDAYLDELVPPVLAQWIIERNGERVMPRRLHASIDAPAGQSGMSTLRVLAELGVEPMAHPAQRVTIHVVDRSYSDRTGFRDLRADDSDDARLVSAPPDSPVTAPDGTTLRRVDEATFVFELRAMAPTSQRAPANAITTRPSHARTVWMPVAASVAWLCALALGLGRRGVDTRVRLVVAVAFAIGAGIAGDTPVPLALLGGLAVTGAVAASRSPWWLARRMAIALVWAAGFAAARVLAGPAETHAHHAALYLGARIAIALVALLPVAATTTLTGLADALAGLRLPAVFVDTTVATARGVQILADESTRVARARQLRAPDAGIATRVGLFGSFASTVLERGLQRAQRAHLAMSLRGFDGRLPPRPTRTLRARDAVTAVIALAAVVLAARTP